ncbi:MAG: hypothetical protein U7126_04635 [Microcoleus sp.]
MANQEAKQHQRIALIRQNFHDKTAYKLLKAGAKFFLDEDLHLQGLTNRNKLKHDGNYL